MSAIQRSDASAVVTQPGSQLGPDLVVAPVRPRVADLLGPDRMGLGALWASADPLVVLGRACYRLDADVCAHRVSTFERVSWAAVVDFRDARRFPIEYPLGHDNVARLAAHAFGPLPPLVAVELSGTFTGVVVANGTFGRAAGKAVGFVTNSPEELGPGWQLSFLTADRTFGGPILEIAIEDAELRVVAPRVVYQATATPT